MRPVGWLPSDSKQFSLVSDVLPFLFISFSFVPKSRSSLVLLGLSFSSSLLRHSPCCLHPVQLCPLSWDKSHNLLKLNFPAIGKEFWLQLTTLCGAENSGRSFLSDEMVKLRLLQYHIFKSNVSIAKAKVLYCLPFAKGKTGGGCFLKICFCKGAAAFLGVFGNYISKWMATFFGSL